VIFRESRSFGARMAEFVYFDPSISIFWFSSLSSLVCFLCSGYGDG